MCTVCVFFQVYVFILRIKYDFYVISGRLRLNLMICFSELSTKTCKLQSDLSSFSHFRVIFLQHRGSALPGWKWPEFSWRGTSIKKDWWSFKKLFDGQRWFGLYEKYSSVVRSCFLNIPLFWARVLLWRSEPLPLIARTDFLKSHVESVTEHVRNGPLCPVWSLGGCSHDCYRTLVI